MKQTTYKESGVDIEKSEQTLSGAKEMIRSTFTPGVLSNVGSFGGLFELDKNAYDQPVLVSSTDGVGTKLRVAVMAGKHNTVGEDLVNHCVNDIAVLGAKPLFFLDYYATAHLEDQVFQAVLSGFARGCRASGCALIGGETAEMPGIYHDDDYDLCGTIVGIVDKKNIISGHDIQKGDVLIGLESNGLHTNGYSLARHVLFSKYTVEDRIDELGETVGDALLRVHRCYLEHIQAVLHHSVHGIAHITGGGIVGNTSRLLREGLSLRVDWDAWEIPSVFNIIQSIGNVPEKDMRRTFNLGIGLILIVSKRDADAALKSLTAFAEKSLVVGEIV